MQLSPLTAISPIDGRYRAKSEQLAEYFSEFALIRYRLVVEVKYFLFLEDRKFFRISFKGKEKIKEMMNNFSLEDAAEIKKIEQETNHDVKAVEYFFKAFLDKNGMREFREWVHFGLTSQDINNTAFPLMFGYFTVEVYVPALQTMVTKMEDVIKKWRKIPMLAHTHGQPASPTMLGKEIMVFLERIKDQTDLLGKVRISGKFGGATGNFNAHYAAFPDTDWHMLGDHFLNNFLGLDRQQYTTQIEHYDMLAARLDCMRRINTILIDFCRDMWMYISMDYFKQKTKKGEVGSSAMPHKVNPIDFENAEGNLGLASAMLDHLSNKLPVSRLQRDLTDSTVLRNLGVPLAHILISFQSIEKGIDKLVLNQDKITADLNNNWVVISEAIQTILRRENYPNPYEALKDLTRGQQPIDKETLHNFIDGLKIKASVKNELKNITPENYTGKMP